jgi:hypothetical protein
MDRCIEKKYMKALMPILLIAAGLAVWYHYANSPDVKQSEGERILADAAQRATANQADIEARTALAAKMRREAEIGKATEEKSASTSMAQDDAAMARERLQSWRAKTTPRN